MKKLIPIILIAMMSFGGPIMAQQSVVSNSPSTNATTAQPMGLKENVTMDEGMSTELSTVDQQLTDSTQSPNDDVVIYFGSGLVLILIIVLLIILL